MKPFADFVVLFSVLFSAQVLLRAAGWLSDAGWASGLGQAFVFGIGFFWYDRIVRRRRHNELR